MNQEISKTCKKCLVEYTNEEVNKFHGRVCRLCKNKALYILNKKKRESFAVYKKKLFLALFFLGAVSFIILIGSTKKIGSKEKITVYVLVFFCDGEMAKTILNNK